MTYKKCVWQLSARNYLAVAEILEYSNKEILEWGILVACRTQIFGIITVGENPGGMAG